MVSMKIGIILHPYGEGKPAGLGRFIFELTKALLEADAKNQYTLFIKEAPETAPNFPGTNWKIEILGSSRWWLENLQRKPKADVYIFNTPVMPLFWRPKKSIVIAFDFAYKHLTGMSARERIVAQALEWYHGHSLKKADLIVATSEATKRDIINFFKISADKIRVVYTGFNRICDIVPVAVRVPKPFFLFTGVVKKRKNVLNIIKGFAEFDKKNPGYNLIIAGSAAGEYAGEARQFVSERGLREKVLFLGYVSDSELSFLYKNAAAFVFPSLIEGFIGLPVLEAMDCGLAVLASKDSALAEVGGKDSAIFVDPYDPIDIAAGLFKIANDEISKRKLIENGCIISQRFSWALAAREIKTLAENL